MLKNLPQELTDLIWLSFSPELEIQMKLFGIMNEKLRRNTILAEKLGIQFCRDIISKTDLIDKIMLHTEDPSLLEILRNIDLTNPEELLSARLFELIMGSYDPIALSEIFLHRPQLNFSEYIAEFKKLDLNSYFDDIEDLILYPSSIAEIINEKKITVPEEYEILVSLVEGISSLMENILPYKNLFGINENPISLFRMGRCYIMMFIERC